MPVCVGAGRSAAGPTSPAAAMQHRRRGCSAGPHPALPPGPAPGTAGHSPGEDLRHFAVWSETTWRSLFFQKKARKRPRELWLRWPPPVFSCSLARRAQYPKDKSRAYWNRGTDSVCLRLCGSVSIINRFAASSDWSRGRFFCYTFFSLLQEISCPVFSLPGPRYLFLPLEAKRIARELISPDRSPIQSWINL